MKPPRIYTYKDTASLTQWVIWLLYAQIAVAVLALISGLMEHQFLSSLSEAVFTSQEAMDEAAEGNDARQGMVGALQILVFIISGILILKWIHRANNNAHALGAQDMQFTPGWAVGWYFVPVAALWKPYQSMKEIWQATKNPQDWKHETVDSLVNWWWGVWIGTNILNNIAAKFSAYAEKHGEHFIEANWVMNFSDIGDIAAALMLLKLVRRLHALQQARRPAPGLTL